MARGVYVGVPKFEKEALPEGYTQVEWIQSTGTQFINTGISVPHASEKVVVEFSPMDVGYDNVLTGHAAPEWSWATNLTFILDARLWVANTGVGLKAMVVDNFYKFEYTSTYYKLDDGEAIPLTTINTSSYTDGYNSTLFYSSTKYGKYKVKSYKLYNGSAMVRNLIPCVNASGEVGMYDLVNSKFYGNAGTGQFIAPVPVELPSGYKQVEWIQSTGTQFIDTGFKPNHNTRVVMDVEIQLNGATGSLFGGRTLYASNDFSFWGVDANSGLTNYGNVSNSISYSVDGRHLIDKDKNVTKLDGVTINTATANTFQSPYNLYLLAAYETTGVDGRNGKGKLYSCKVYDNGILIRNYIPCVNASGTAGLYDLVNSKFYGNNGTGTFAVGEEISAEPKSVARKVKQLYVGVANKARTVKMGYIGIGGVARPFWGYNKVQYYGAITKLSIPMYTTGATTGNYAVFGGGGDATKGTVSDVVNAYSESLTRTNPSNLSVGRWCIGGSIDGYAVFAGGRLQTATSYSNAVDVYNPSLTRTTATALKTYRMSEGSGTVGDYVLFGGGTTGTTTTANTGAVDAYDKSLTRSNPADMHTARMYASASVGDYLIFTGGTHSGAFTTATAYNKSLTKVSAPSLRNAVYEHSGASNGKYAVFAGSHNQNSRTTDAYDSSLTRFDAPDMSSSTREMASTRLGDFAIFAGGHIYPGNYVTSGVTIYDQSLTKTNGGSLSASRYNIASANVGKYAIFAGGYNGEDMDTADAYTLA